MTAAIENTLSMDHSGIIVRPLIGFFVALAVTTGLFWTMQFLIEISGHELDGETTHALLEFVRIERDEEIVRINRIEKPPLPEVQPEMPPQIDTFNPDANIVKIGIPKIPGETDINTIASLSNIYEGDYLPIVKVAPIYPQRALSRGIQGHCVIEYTVTRQGAVRDPMVIDSMCTSSLFHKVSRDAVLKFKYKPRVMDGVAVAVSGVQNKFTFQIED